MHTTSFAGKGIVIPVTVNDIEVNGVVDTGADAIVISADFASVAGIDTKDCKKACVRSTENGQIRLLFGGVTATLQIHSHITS